MQNLIKRHPISPATKDVLEFSAEPIAGAAIAIETD